MKLTLLALSCVAVALIAIACTETATPTNSSTPRAAASPASAAPTAAVDEFANAKAIYTKNCEACHGPKAEGGLAKVNDKQIKVPSLKADHAIKHTDEQLTKMITNGEEQMPAFKDKLKPEEIAEMVRYIRKVVQGKG
jgi:mono/diheme cytochrome c family protein